MTRTVDSAKELAQLADLRDVIFREVAGKRVSHDEGEEKQEIQVLVREEDAEIGVRCIATVQGRGGKYVADVEAIFCLPEEIEVAQEFLLEFVERVGIMVAYPYIRAAISDSAGRLSLERPLMKLMKPGARLAPESATGPAREEESAST